MATAERNEMGKNYLQAD